MVFDRNIHFQAEKLTIIYFGVMMIDFRKNALGADIYTISLETMPALATYLPTKNLRPYIQPPIFPSFQSSLQLASLL